MKITLPTASACQDVCQTCALLLVDRTYTVTMPSLVALPTTPYTTTAAIHIWKLFSFFLETQLDQCQQDAI